MLWIQCLLFSFLFHRRAIVQKFLPAHASTFNIAVQNSEENQRLDVFLTDKLLQYSRSKIGTLCKNGGVKVNTEAENKSYRIRCGDMIEVVVEEEKAPNVRPQNIPLQIIYEDKDILAVNKPNGMVVHPAPGTPNGTFVNALLYHLRGQSHDLLTPTNRNTVLLRNKEDGHTGNDSDDGEPVDILEGSQEVPRVLRPGIVHRLDKGTSGVLLAGKHSLAVDKLSSLFAKRQIGKYYLAVCVGHPGDKTISQAIARSRKNRQVMCTTNDLNGKLAITHTRTIAFDGKLSLVLVKIDTGRTHQIRVHLKDRHTPILGDEVYGHADWNKRYSTLRDIQRPMLHAYHMRFHNPFTTQQVDLFAPLPDDMLELVKAIQHDNIAPYEKDVMLSEGGEKGVLRFTAQELEDMFLTVIPPNADSDNDIDTDEDDDDAEEQTLSTTATASLTQSVNERFVPVDRIHFDTNGMEENDDWTKGY